MNNKNTEFNQHVKFGECRCLYIDLDDVCANWVTEAFTYLRVNYEPGLRIPQFDWARLRNHHRFYKDLQLLPGTSELASQAASPLSFRAADELPWFIMLCSSIFRYRSNR
jgi:hypothetical protein